MLGQMGTAHLVVNRLDPALPGSRGICGLSKTCTHTGAASACWSDFHGSARQQEFVKSRQFANSAWCDQEAVPISLLAACIPAAPGSRAPHWHQVSPAAGLPFTCPMRHLQHSSGLHPPVSVLQSCMVMPSYCVCHGVCMTLATSPPAPGRMPYGHLKWGHLGAT